MGGQHIQPLFFPLPLFIFKTFCFLLLLLFLRRRQEEMIILSFRAQADEICYSSPTPTPLFSVPSEILTGHLMSGRGFSADLSYILLQKLYGIDFATFTPFRRRRPSDTSGSKSQPTENMNLSFLFLRKANVAPSEEKG